MFILISFCRCWLFVLCRDDSRKKAETPVPVHWMHYLMTREILPSFEPCMLETRNDTESHKWNRTYNRTFLHSVLGSWFGDCYQYRHNLFKGESRDWVRFPILDTVFWESVLGIKKLIWKQIIFSLPGKITHQIFDGASFAASCEECFAKVEKDRKKA